MASLAVAPVPLDKEAWENVPSIIFSSIRTMAINQNSMKNWAIGMENKLTQVQKTLHEDGPIISRLNNIDKSVRSLTTHQTVMSSLLWTGVKNLNAKIKQLQTHADYTRSVQKMLIQKADEFRASVSGTPKSNGPAESIDDHMSIMDGVFSALRDTGDRLRGEIQTANESIQALTKGVEAHDRDLDDLRRRGEESAEQIALAAAGLSSVEEEVASVKGSTLTRDKVEKKIELIHQAAKQSYEQMSHVVKQWQSHQTDTNQRLKKAIEDISVSSERGLQVLQANVFGAVKEHLDPISTFVNNLHQRHEEQEVAVQEIQKQLPGIYSELDTKTTDLRTQEASIDHLRCSFNDQVQRLERAIESTEQDRLKGEAFRATQVSQQEERFNETLDSLREQLDCELTTQEWHQEEITATLKRLQGLEMRFRNWIETTLLPRKVAEARLFALETRVEEEFWSRLELQHAVLPEAPPPKRNFWKRLRNEADQTHPAASTKDTSSTFLPALPSPTESTEAQSGMRWFTGSFRPRDKAKDGPYTRLRARGRRLRPAYAVRKSAEDLKRLTQTVRQEVEEQMAELSPAAEALPAAPPPPDVSDTAISPSDSPSPPPAADHDHEHEPTPPPRPAFITEGGGSQLLNVTATSLSRPSQASSLPAREHHSSFESIEPLEGRSEVIMSSVDKDRSQEGEVVDADGVWGEGADVAGLSVTGWTYSPREPRKTLTSVLKGGKGTKGDR
ncbi:unnamed protein product [Vitrella brassicaformis CCMP3155]|uniref:Uncharacterized protein n=1 Tax=Vitrella brassicaformis (strain CCMP3155) TaxID=1169540 RepID=A0A0G4GYA5_VITBC|nr:unnamed protein product [Vitrella brassicaformis CCMP3155]|eukprot:CEM35961.1 unnamed protein product [Vitrella brassicaformis CCMP3155]